MTCSMLSHQQSIQKITLLNIMSNIIFNDETIEDKIES